MADTATAPIVATHPLLQPGNNCWRIERAERFRFIVDADDYFTAVRAAMLRAKHSIFLIGWDFDARITLGNQCNEGPAQLGEFFLWLARRTPTLEIRLLRWDTGAFKAMLRGSTLWTILRWKAHPRITLQLDGAHPFASSHHEKIVVIDDSLAFCGGIDLTCDRWDRRAHADDDPQRVRPDGKPHPPWHDATSAFDGAAARAMGELVRTRWLAATGERLPSTAGASDPWPSALAPTFTQVRLGLSRTRPNMPGVDPVHEIERIYLDLIARARHTIYLESQYFAARKIARALALRLQEEDGPEIVIINPLTADGWLEPLAMDTARARLVEALQRMDHHRRLRIYHPQTARGTPIYVHAKVVIIDDQYLRVGSSNVNNRSLRLDSECDVILAADEPGNAKVADTIVALRDDLLAEHLDVEPATVSAAVRECGLIGAIERLRGQGRTLVPYTLPELNAAEVWLADNEILDPEGPDQMFEALERRSLFKNWHLPWRRRRQRGAPAPAAATPPRKPTDPAP